MAWPLLRPECTVVRRVAATMYRAERLEEHFMKSARDAKAHRHRGGVPRERCLARRTMDTIGGNQGQGCLGPLADRSPCKQQRLERR
jgi:hypothetical protein